MLKLISILLCMTRDTKWITMLNCLFFFVSGKGFHIFEIRGDQILLEGGNREYSEEGGRVIVNSTVCCLIQSWICGGGGGWEINPMGWSCAINREECWCHNHISLTAACTHTINSSLVRPWNSLPADQQGYSHWQDFLNLHWCLVGTNCK